MLTTRQTTTPGQAPFLASPQASTSIAPPTNQCAGKPSALRGASTAR